MVPTYDSLKNRRIKIMSREPKTKEETMEAIALVNPNYKSFTDEYRRVKSQYKTFNNIENAWDRIYYFMPQIFSKAFELSDDKNSFEDIFHNIILKYNKFLHRQLLKA